eukprot:4679310-Amphidinium_carterae.1
MELRNCRDSSSAALPEHRQGSVHEFVEDYNTATMPHKKYYNLNAYESAQMAKNRGKKKDSAKCVGFILTDTRYQKSGGGSQGELAVCPNVP